VHRVRCSRLESEADLQVSRGTVYLRGRTWTIGYTVGHRRFREAIGTNRQMAEAVLKKRIVQALEGRHFNVRNEGRIPFSEFAATYTERCISVLKSAKTERDRVQFWVREFGSRPIGQISRAELQSWQALKRQTCKPATVNRILCRLRHMFNRATDWELLDQSPMKGIKFLLENNARLRYLTLEECQLLIDSCKAPHLRAIVTIALHTGMRSGEIRNLQWRDLDFDTGFLIVRDSKNGETRHVPMDSTVVALLHKWPRTVGSDIVFTNAAGDRIGWMQHGFRKALRRAGLSDLHFHDLRHTFASQWMMAGGDLYVLRSILGHKSVAMTQRYAHLSPAYKRAMVDRTEQIWAKPASQPAQMPVPKNSRRLLKRNSHPTKTAVAVNA
jgi:integrase